MITKEDIPNLLTISRGILTVIMLGIFYTDWSNRYWLIMGLFCLGAVSDWLDGKLARKFNCASKWGIVFDSMLDKVMILAVLAALIPYQLFPSWVYVMFLCRELIVDSTKSHFASLGETVKPRWSGKIKMASQTLLIIVCLGRLIGESELLTLATGWLAGVGLVTAYYSGWQYMKLWWKK